MKKFYLILGLLVSAAGIASAQCTINAAAQTTPGVNPTAPNLPCIERGVAYDQTLQGKIQTSKDTTIAGFQATIVVDSVSLDSILGLPTGINWVKNPDVLPGGGNGCVRFSGTTNDPVGNYNLTARGRVWFHVQVPQFGLDTAYNYQGNLNQFSPFGNYYVTVINTGSACHSVGVNDFSNELNSALSVYPNPNNGSFEFKLNAGHRVNGELVVVDVTGKLVYSQKLDVVGLYNTTINLTDLPKGIYALQLRTEEGYASKTITIE